jgi:hypothetical protein
VCHADVGAAVRALVLSSQRQAFSAYLDRVVFDGDSLTAEATSTYPAQCLALLPGKTGFNAALGGRTTSALLTTTNVHPYGGLVLDDIYALWIGVNDLLVSVAVATVYANIVNVVTQRIYANFEQVIVCTLTDCQGAGRPAGFDEALPALNTLIRDGAATYGYTVADLMADARLQDATDTTYFNADKTHLVEAGYTVVAGIVAAAIS